MSNRYIAHPQDGVEIEDIEDELSVLGASDIVRSDDGKAVLFDAELDVLAAVEASTVIESVDKFDGEEDKAA